MANPKSCQPSLANSSPLSSILSPSSPLPFLLLFEFQSQFMAFLTKTKTIWLLPTSSVSSNATFVLVQQIGIIFCLAVYFTQKKLFSSLYLDPSDLSLSIKLNLPCQVNSTCYSLPLTHPCNVFIVWLPCQNINYVGIETILVPLCLTYGFLLNAC